MYAMGQQYVKSRDYFRAGHLFSQCLQVAPGHLSALISLAGVLYAIGHIESAKNAYRRAIRVAPNHLSVLIGLANCYRAEGKFKKAIQHYEMVLKVDPHNAESIYSLVTLSRYNPDAPVARRAQALWNSTDCSPQARVFAGFALARLYESNGDHRGAFPYYAEANALAFSLVQYDEAAYLGAFGQVQTTFSREFFARWECVGSKEETKQTQPIFVLGMPRSGTSLIEQILASHSRVHGAGELNLMPYLAEVLIPEITGAPFPQAVHCLDKSAIAKLADYFFSSLSSRCPDGRDHVVDKTPLNFLLIGLIRLIAPNTRIVHCVRDPLDTCWSMFRQHFIGSAHPYCYDQSALGRYYRAYQGLMEHWRKVLPGDVYDLQYERLVAEPAATIRDLLEYCRLPWEESCLAFHRTRRVVSTASEMQVRRPIYKASVRSWLPFADQLAPLRAALEIH